MRQLKHWYYFVINQDSRHEKLCSACQVHSLLPLKYITLILAIKVVYIVALKSKFAISSHFTDAIIDSKFY